jgi:hypothetical protein
MEWKGPIAKIHVEADGTILLDGKPTSLEDLKEAFVELKRRDGAV